MVIIFIIYDYQKKENTMQLQNNGISKIISYTPPTLMDELKALSTKIEGRVKRNERHEDPLWSTLCTINNQEKKSQYSYLSGSFLPTINLPINAVKGKIVDLGKGRKIILDNRLGYMPEKLYIDFGFRGDKMEVRYCGKFAEGAKKINRVVNRHTNPRKATTSDLSAAQAKAFRKGWYGDAAIYYLWAIINGVKYGYVGCTKIRDDDANADAAAMRRGHEHIVSGSAIGEYLEQADEGYYGHQVIKELTNVDSDYAYGLEGEYIDWLNVESQKKDWLVRVNIHNNGDRDYPDAVRRTNVMEFNPNKNYNPNKKKIHHNPTYTHKSVGANKKSYIVSDKRKGEEYAAKCRNSRSFSKNLSYNEKVDILKLIIDNKRSLSGQSTMDWLVSNGVMPEGIGRTVINRCIRFY